MTTNVWGEAADPAGAPVIDTPAKGEAQFGDAEPTESPSSKPKESEAPAEEGDGGGFPGVPVLVGVGVLALLAIGSSFWFVTRRTKA